MHTALTEPDAQGRNAAIFTKFCLFRHSLWIRRYPAAHIFFIDHSNDLAVNIFGLIMSILGDRFAWYLDPIGGHLHCAPHPLLLGRNRVRQRLAAGWQDCATRRKLGGLASVERAFDHADHEDTHNPMRSTNRYILPLGRRGEPFERG
ncbi:cation diffusion facilitator 1 [Blastomyces gilchristii SLH14081]|uniref:Cation diffusion facilitator 1 n=1 Tax=Blastomyces gilchristii (strain SLH14081) TaxID=559298 RepID=A0A179UKY3_BLAGS|nr:cation diffusion facilitator 1 [Blastomyces gilchristii SLH14081]OAT07062.1 cation diffusion facilitator 1 [Blastomyces gilchristii SLH14081]